MKIFTDKEKAIIKLNEARDLILSQGQKQMDEFLMLDGWLANALAKVSEAKKIVLSLDVEDKIAELCGVCFFMEHSEDEDGFFDSNGDTFEGRCRRMPEPQLVDYNDWCGEWKRKT